MSTADSGLIDPWLQTLWDRGGTDLLITKGSPPRVRVDGGLRPIDGEAVTSSFWAEGKPWTRRPADVNARTRRPVVLGMAPVPTGTPWARTARLFRSLKCML